MPKIDYDNLIYKIIDKTWLALISIGIFLLFVAAGVIKQVVISNVVWQVILASVGIFMIAISLFFAWRDVKSPSRAPAEANRDVDENKHLMSEKICSVLIDLYQTKSNVTVEDIFARLSRKKILTIDDYNSLMQEVARHRIKQRQNNK